MNPEFCATEKLAAGFAAVQNSLSFSQCLKNSALRPL
jgi:hypothetical protein